MGEDDRINKRWEEYFQGKLCEGKKYHMRKLTDERTNDSRKTHQTRGRWSNRATKEQQVQRHDKIAAENIKYGGEKMKQQMYEIVLEIFGNKILPNQCNHTAIIPMIKKEDTTNCNLYRESSLLDIVDKVLAIITTKRK